MIHKNKYIMQQHKQAHKYATTCATHASAIPGIITTPASPLPIKLV